MGGTICFNKHFAMAGGPVVQWLGERMPRRDVDVLVVDCRDADAEQTMFVLGRIHGIRALRLTDGRQASDFILQTGLYGGGHHSVPRLLVLESELPCLDAFSLIERVREAHTAHELPIVMFSSCANELVVERCQQLGANDYIIKPTQREAYSLRVKDLVAKWITHRGRAHANRVSWG